MKIGLDNKIHLLRSSLSSSRVKGPEGGRLTSAITAQTMREDLNYNINTTASKNTRGRMSFKGVNSTIEKTAEELSAKLTDQLGKEIKVTPKVLTLIERLEKNEKLKKIMDFVGTNSLLSEALFAVVITCGLRPAVILASPGKGENKEKNQYAAAHSVASGLIGLAATIAISQPIKNAMNAIAEKKLFGGITPEFKGLTEEQLLKATEEELKTNASLIKANQLIRGKEVGATKSVLERIHNPGFLPLRAMATIALIPMILGAFGMKKADKNKQKEIDKTGLSQQTQILMPPNTKKVFQSFAGVSQNENK